MLNTNVRMNEEWEEEEEKEEEEEEEAVGALKVEEEVEANAEGEICVDSIPSLTSAACMLPHIRQCSWHSPSSSSASSALVQSSALSYVLVQP